jgi:hypothetical protein
LGSEPRVDVGDVPPKFAPNYGLNVSVRKRCDFVEQFEEFVAIVWGKEVEPSCKGLAELYPGCPELLEREAEPDMSRHAATSRELELREDTVFENGAEDLD